MWTAVVAQMSSSSSVPAALMEADQVAALARARGKGKDKGKSKSKHGRGKSCMRKDSCFRCRQPGHRVAECPQLESELGAGNPNDSVCWCCGCGHRSRECPMRLRQQQKLIRATSSTVSSTVNTLMEEYDDGDIQRALGITTPQQSGHSHGESQRCESFDSQNDHGSD